MKLPLKFFAKLLDKLYYLVILKVVLTYLFFFQALHLPSLVIYQSYKDDDIILILQIKYQYVQLHIHLIQKLK